MGSVLRTPSKGVILFQRGFLLSGLTRFRVRLPDHEFKSSPGFVSLIKIRSTNEVALNCLDKVSHQTRAVSNASMVTPERKLKLSVLTMHVLFPPWPLEESDCIGLQIEIKRKEWNEGGKEHYLPNSQFK
ncbi:Uncharacterized protein DAT39_011814 [Clarias magur]|uniref:Uncharacterized protein n=1 Tax=Clarias magur TaxID=1594786 RepID=A0A8J4U2T4_CLAMG|nr:Uncharacterized protein DAT39_011814 [Clarias magur]